MKGRPGRNDMMAYPMLDRVAEILLQDFRKTLQKSLEAVFWKPEPEDSRSGSVFRLE